jgi:hypothetical protein
MMAITISRGSPNAKSWSGPGFNPEILILDDGVALRGAINHGNGGSEIEFKIDLDSFILGQRDDGSENRA